ncbi:uncharacterized protein LOC125507730 [Triticum urartu]|uniref:uncharacterized protein LOC125507730 n=1 Tax=Triticum urartu TaxID=4572 RepID=UPI002044C321|nr:uncharacterized protein LOC125507730 [Triticum urartu]
MDQGQAMQADHDGLSAIVEASETHVNHLYMNRGTSIDLYKFRKYSNQQGWKHGHIFHGSNREDLSFEGGMIQGIKARDNTNSREAMFLVEAANQWVSVEDTMVRSSTTLNHIGILKPFVGGFNTQISEVVCGFTSIINSSLTGWLTSKQPSDKRTSIPVEVQQLIRSGWWWSCGARKSKVVASVLRADLGREEDSSDNQVENGES